MKRPRVQAQYLTLAQPTIKNGDFMTRNKSALMLGVLLLFFATGAWADGLTSAGILDKVIEKFSEKAPTWESEVHKAALYLFASLASISMVWVFKEQILKLDFNGFFGELLRFGVTTGFFLFLLENGPAMAMSIIDSLRLLAGKAMGLNKSLSPSDIVDTGFLIWKQAISNLSAWSPIDSFIGVILSIVILMILALIAVNMMVLLISAWILAYAGQFLLAFGGSSWTSDMAISFFKTVLSIAIQLFVMTLLIGVGNDLLTEFYNKMNKGQLDFEQLGIMLVFCLALFMLVGKVPSMVAGIVSGGGAGGGIGNFGAGAAIGAAMGAASMAGAALAGAGSAMMSGAANVAGVADAISAASESGGGSEAGSDPGMGSILSSSNNPGGAKEDGAAALGQLMGDNNTGGGQPPSMGSRLTQGIKAAAQNKVGQIKNDFADKVAQTPGGQVASAIRANNDAVYNSGAPTPDGGADNNSLSAGGNSQADEIAAFVNKTSGSSSQDGGSNT